MQINLSLLLTLLIVLKLMNLISISWIWVFSPIWIPLFLICFIVTTVQIFK